MDVSFVIRQRLELLGVGQKDLARAARVTESYISQLLSRKKAPPAPGRTDIYDRMDRFLELPPGYKLESWDPQYPHENFESFVKQCLRGLSSARHRRWFYRSLRGRRRRA